jgi:hypothetical protein
MQGKLDPNSSPENLDSTPFRLYKVKALLQDVFQLKFESKISEDKSLFSLPPVPSLQSIQLSLPSSLPQQLATFIKKNAETQDKMSALMF